ncbi:MAG: M48 family metallopeptidase [Bacteroides sp.]|nr:M48 family metallopeptidase [Bacteroides sp.]
MKFTRRIKSLLLSFAIATVVSVPVINAQNWGRLLQGGLELLQSFSVSDDQVKGFVSQFIAESDKTNKLADNNSEYTRRLNKIVSGITSVDGQPLNFKVYITKDINAFACADGSVRVYSGLMDVMTDDEVLGVIGHEVGHVAHHDTRNAMKNALRTTALKDAIASTGNTAAILTDSQLGTLGQAYLSSKYSRKQESNADDYGYEFLKKHNKNPLVLCLAFKKLESLENSSGTQSLVSKMFSTHPDTESRIKAIEKKAYKEGYTYPTR